MMGNAAGKGASANIKRGGWWQAPELCRRLRQSDHAPGVPNG